ALRALGSAVFVEAIRTQRGAKCDVRGRLGGVYRRRLADIDGDNSLAHPNAVEMRDKRPTDVFRRAAVERFRLAEPNDDNTAHRQFGRRDDRNHFVALTAKTWRRGERAGNRAVACLVKLAGWRGQGAVFPYSHD